MTYSKWFLKHFKSINNFDADVEHDSDLNEVSKSAESIPVTKASPETSPTSGTRVASGIRRAPRAGAAPMASRASEISTSSSSSAIDPFQVYIWNTRGSGFKNVGHTSLGNKNVYLSLWPVESFAPFDLRRKNIPGRARLNTSLKADEIAESIDTTQSGGGFNQDIDVEREEQTDRVPLKPDRIIKLNLTPTENEQLTVTVRDIQEMVKNGKIKYSATNLFNHEGSENCLTIVNYALRNTSYYLPKPGFLPETYGKKLSQKDEELSHKIDEALDKIEVSAGLKPSKIEEYKSCRKADSKLADNDIDEASTKPRSP